MEESESCKRCGKSIEQGRATNAIYCVSCSFKKLCKICYKPLPKKRSKYCSNKCSKKGQHMNRLERYKKRGNKWRPKGDNGKTRLPDNREELIRIVTEMGLDVGGFY